jgi:hypothetical protein
MISEPRNVLPNTEFLGGGGGEGREGEGEEEKERRGRRRKLLTMRVAHISPQNKRQRKEVT